MSLPGQTSTSVSPQDDKWPHTRTAITWTQADLGAQLGQKWGDCVNDKPRCARPIHHLSPGDHLGPLILCSPWTGPPLSREPSLCPVLTSLFQGTMKKLACNLCDFLPTAATPCLLAAGCLRQSGVSSKISLHTHYLQRDKALSQNTGWFVTPETFHFNSLRNRSGWFLGNKKKKNPEKL